MAGSDTGRALGWTAAIAGALLLLGLLVSGVVTERRGAAVTGAAPEIKVTAIELEQLDPPSVRALGPGAIAEPAAVERVAAPLGPSPDATEELTVVVLGMGSGDTAEVTLERHGLHFRRATDRATDARNPDVRTGVARGPEGRVVFERHDGSGSRMVVRAEGFARHVEDIESGRREVQVELVPVDPVTIDFPGLAGRPGTFELSVSFGTGFEPVSIDAAGRATLPFPPVARQVGFVLGTYPERAGGDQAFPLLGGSVSVTEVERNFRFADVVARRVEFLPPVPGESFELWVEIVPPYAVQLPSKPGWSGPYGLYRAQHIASDPVGVLVVQLLEGATSELRFVGAISGEFEPEGFEVVADGPIALVRKVEGGR